jgi:hypothetical protein
MKNQLTNISREEADKLIAEGVVQEIPNKNIEGWEENAKDIIYKSIDWREWKQDVNYEPILDFIRNLLSAQREQIIKGKFYDKIEIHEEISIPKEIIDKIKSAQRSNLVKEIEGFAIMKGSVIDKLEEKTERERITNLLNENLEIGYRQACKDILNLINSSK